ncbi:hypothetical protein [Halocalculus aciditolerans]|uniref:Uncharacterized protein n=1 Tax=Halocalculus aciditolerans TaxID=1383812 RepID=A0A830FI00_9EURY|nr:hypothetical protein [Halocalculus aciditolerans]GGL57887.1 hypothetical protein GCM10009039_15070 [Halocalculus aciditolerans]
MSATALEEREEEDVDEDVDEELPEIDESERAELDSDLLSEIEEESRPDDQDDEAGEADDASQDDATDETADDVESDDALGNALGDASTLGDAYVGLLALVCAAVIVSENDGADLEQKASDVEAMTDIGPFDLARDVDRLLDQQGAPTEMPPWVSVLLGSVAIVGAVLVLETDLASNAIERLMDNYDL